MLNPLDVLARAVAIPAIVWSAFTDGFFDLTEERCRTRWADLLPADQQDRRAA